MRVEELVESLKKLLGGIQVPVGTTSGGLTLKGPFATNHHSLCRKVGEKHLNGPKRHWKKPLPCGPSVITVTRNGFLQK